MSSTQKKVLIICNNHHSNIGGIETYTKNLINVLLKNNFKVYEVNMDHWYKDEEKINKEKRYSENLGINYKHIQHNLIKTSNKFLQKIRIIYYLVYILNGYRFAKFIKRFCKQEKIDIVINNTCWTKFYFLKNIKYIWVQHNMATNYFKEELKAKIWKFISFTKSDFNWPNIVLYNKKDLDCLKKLIKHKSNVYTILPGFNEKNDILKSKEDFDFYKKNEVVYIGRLSDNDKNISFLKTIINAANANDFAINVYGSGRDEGLLKNEQKIILHGYIEQRNISKIFSKTKVLLLPSKMEAFGLIISEALANGVPCIVSEKCFHADFLINKSNGFIIDNFDPIKWVEKIKTINNLSEKQYKEISDNCFAFAIDYLLINSFEEKWLKVLNS